MNQTWAVTINGANLTFRARHSSRCITSTFAGLVQTAAACTSAGWELIPFGTYKRVMSDYGGKCLDVSASSTSDGAKVQQWDCLAWTAYNQRFHLRLIDVSNPGGGTGRARYQILASHSSKCIKPNGSDWGNWHNGTTVLQYSCSAQADAYWEIWPIYSTGGGIRYQVREWYNTGFCMDMDNVNGNANGNKIQFWGCNGWTNQSWLIKELS